jgi:hypothetical protein
MVDMEVIVRSQDQELCASITCMIRHYVARRAEVIFDHPHNADDRAMDLTDACMCDAHHCDTSLTPKVARALGRSGRHPGACGNGGSFGCFDAEGAPPLPP